MTMVMKRITKGVVLRPESSDVTENVEGSLWQNSTSERLKTYIESAVREVVTNSQAQTLTNKTIDVDNNTVSNIETDNLKSGVLNTSTTLTGASDTQIPSALAVKTYVDDKAAAQNEASEIAVSPAVNGEVTVQASLEDHETRIGTALSDSSTALSTANAAQGDIDDHIADTAGAHAASAIANTPSGNLAATDVQGALNELQSDIDTRATSSALTTHTGASTDVHGLSGGAAVVGTTSTQTLTNKTITGASLQTPIRSDVKQDTKANLVTYAGSATNGQLVFATDEKKMYQIVDNALIDVGSGAGGINHIGNGTAENDTTGYATYADAAAAQPIDATGGSANITFTRSTSSPLRGDASFLLSKDAVDRQGNGVSYDFSIDAADQAQVLRISFDYETSANYADGDIRVYIYDVTNAQLIEVVDRDLYASAFGKYTGSFQTSSNSTSYRLVFHVASVNALAYTVKIDNVVVGPQNLIKGAIVTDWESYVPTFTGLGIVTNASGRFKRIGDHLEVSVSCTTGTTAASLASISLPSGLLIDSSKVSISNTTANPGSLIGNYNTSQTTAGMIGNVVTAPSTSTALVYIGDRDGNAGSHLTPVNGSTAISSSSTFSATFKVPIVGWSSNMTLSEDAGNREIACTVNLAGNQTVSSTAATTVQFNTIVLDTAAAFETGSYQFRFPESGLYDVDANLYLSGLTANESYSVTLELDGSPIMYDTHTPSTTVDTFRLNKLLSVSKGSTLYIRVQSTADTSYTINGSSARTFFSIAKRSSPQTVAASEIVACRYNTNSGQAVTSGNNIIFEDVVYDTHNAYNTSTGIWTCPQSGYYRLEAGIETSGFASTVGHYFAIDVRNLASGQRSFVGLNYIETTTSTSKSASGSTTMYFSKGDTGVLRFAENTTAVALTGDSNTNWMTITKINGVS